MTIRQVLRYPAEVLKTVARPVVDTDDIHGIFSDMIETMVATEGVGIAAPQIGISLRMIVVAENPQLTKIWKLVNPVLEQKFGDVESVEGCLSIPKVQVTLNRASRVIVSALDDTGKEVRIDTGEGATANTFFAICLQHEIDHLNGITTLDRLSPLKRDMVLWRVRKLGLWSSNFPAPVLASKK